MVCLQLIYIIEILPAECIIRLPYGNTLVINQSNEGGIAIELCCSFSLLNYEKARIPPRTVPCESSIRHQLFEVSHHLTFEVSSEAMIPTLSCMYVFIDEHAPHDG